MLSTVKAMPMNETCVSLSRNSTLIGSTSTLTTIRSMNPTVLIAMSRTSVSYGESRCSEANMRGIPLHSRGSENDQPCSAWLAEDPILPHQGEGLIQCRIVLAPPVVRGHRAAGGQLGLVAFLALRLGQRLPLPLLHRRMGEHSVDPRLARTHVESIRADPERDRRIERIGRAEFRTGEPRSAEALES